ncbi:hypothetical protein [Amycolatopsis sp. lyj-346]|uniref:hypothetical protein n=1 Tax=Amycolatopsis sp. lyj-346 TaxID=2789289 RepID=UPI003978F5BC
MGTVVGLTFLFGFGNVLSLALQLGVPAWVAPLVAPAVDLSILGLLLSTRHLALTGASPAVLRPARRLLIFASIVTLALNVAEPLVAGEYGKAAFDAVGPLLLIGWAEVGAGLLQAIGEAGQKQAALDFADVEQAEERAQEKSNGRSACSQVQPAAPQDGRRVPAERAFDALLDQARRENAAHRAAHQKPISADTLRVRLRVGAARARQLVKIVRAEDQAEVPCNAVGGKPARDAQSRPTALVA